MVDGLKTAAGVPVPLCAPWAAAHERTLEVPPALTARAAAGLSSPAAVFFCLGNKERGSLVEGKKEEEEVFPGYFSLFLSLSFLPESIAARCTMCVAPLSATAFLFEFFFQVWVGFGQRGCCCSCCSLAKRDKN
jgi:hypothetical protein